MKINISCPYLPKYWTEGASGFDLESTIDVIINSGEFVKIPTGLRIDLPESYELQIRSRSGLSSKGIVVLNSPGTIDSDYKQEIHVLLINHSKSQFSINKGMRIAQGILAQTIKADLVNIEEIKDTTNRGSFGSTN